MGWVFEDAAEHEGYLRGFIRDVAGELHALAYGLPGSEDEQAVDVVVCECRCGWRSSPIAAPTAAYVPYDVVVHDDVEDYAWDLWRTHVRDVLVTSAEMLTRSR